MTEALWIYAIIATLALVRARRALMDADRWILHWQRREADACDRANEWQAKAQPHEATRARWRRAISENADLRAANRTLWRRLRGVLWQARAWKAEAVARGWTREEKNRDASALKALRREVRARRLGENVKDMGGES